METTKNKRGTRVREFSSSENAARTVLAPFLKRLKKPGLSRGKIDEEQQKTYVRSKIKNVVTKLMSFCADNLELPTVLNETSEILREVTKAMSASSYFVDDKHYIVLNAKYMPMNRRHTVRYKIEPGKTVAAYVAYSQDFVMVDDVLGDPRFPLGVAGTGKLVKSVLSVPVLTSADGECIAVIELYRDICQDPFSPLDLQICVSMAGWMGAAIHQNNERLFLLKKSELSNYLTSLVEFFFADALSFDKFVSDIIECAKLAVGADRAYFYLMDGEIPINTEEEIVADVYEEGLDSVHFSYKKKNKQRFSKNSKLLPGYIARHGRLVNVHDAFDDHRFTTMTDISGSITRSMIGVPLKGSLGVIGVLLLVNKLREDSFNSEDEILLQNIAAHAYLACQHGCIKDQLRKSYCRLIGNQDLLKVQMKPSMDDVKGLLSEPNLKKTDLPNRFFEFDWIILGKEKHAPKYAVFMFMHLLGDKYFDYPTLVEFILTVRKSYRDNHYHNFAHAFTVCHCMFNVINRNKESFTELEILGSLVATICHDSDHLGYTNNFLQMTNHWLAELYWESPLEHHHYDVCILMIEGSNILSGLSCSEWTALSKFLKHLILATDLVHFFRQRNQMCNLLKTKLFDWDLTEHRMMFMGILMTVCDVSGQCKPFYTAKKVTEGLYREFYNQGDVEKHLGLTPMSMMDREKTSTIPENQFQFLTLVCIPSVEMLVAVFPNTKELLQQCTELRDCWSIILSKKVIGVWKIDEALLPNTGKRRRSTKKE